MKKIEFYMALPRNPKGTAQQIRHTQHGHYIPKHLKETMEMYIDALRPHSTELLTGPLQLVISFEYETKDKKKFESWKTSVPDCDNIVKPFIDCMTRTGFWMDDSQIVWLSVRKKWSCAPGIWVTIKELTDDRS